MQLVKIIRKAFFIGYKSWVPCIIILHPCLNLNSHESSVWPGFCSFPGYNVIKKVEFSCTS
ncbi:unnamed protein product, partial [Vitis vinifera]|uniref:Uncharacterized protein n=1 Tax=Vitis vinifera TaxID=29760 RepID=D7TRW1_VITVI